MLRRLGLMAACVTLLAGCESYGDLTSDAFDPGNATQSAFTLDAARCEAEGGVARDGTILGIEAPNDVRHEIFNRAYVACMGRHGYARRDWSPDIPDPYAFDPTP